MADTFNPARVSNIRKAKNLTQLELSALSGVTPTTISRVETGAHMPSLTTLRRLAKALSVTVSDFYADVDPYEGTGTDSYDPNAFYTRSIDKYGHSRKRVVYYDPHVVDAIENAIKSGKLAGTPITSFEALCRDALVHQMHRIEKLVDEPEFIRAAETERKISRFHLIAERGAKDEAMVTSMMNAVDEAIERKDWETLSNLVDVCDEISNEMLEPWSSRIWAIVMRGKKQLERAEEA